VTGPVTRLPLPSVATLTASTPSTWFSPVLSAVAPSVHRFRAFGTSIGTSCSDTCSGASPPVPVARCRLNRVAVRAG
jgi:hypothetical protein